MDNKSKYLIAVFVVLAAIFVQNGKKNKWFYWIRNLLTSVRLQVIRPFF